MTLQVIKDPATIARAMRDTTEPRPNKAVKTQVVGTPFAIRHEPGPAYWIDDDRGGEPIGPYDFKSVAISEAVGLWAYEAGASA